MNRYKCPACGGEQYTAADTAEGCIYCGHQGELEKMDTLEPAINCRYYVPAWAGNKTSGSQPDFCLKHRVVLCGNCIKGCKEQNK